MIIFIGGYMSMYERRRRQRGAASVNTEATNEKLQPVASDAA
jgi:hypothetical protein